MEIWKPIPGTDGRYEASSAGRIRAFTRKSRGAILKSAATGNGYRMVCISIGGNPQRTWRVHHLVLMAFVGPRPAGMVGCHGNDIPDDNRISNLRWDTPAANVAERLQRGYFRQSTRAKLTRADVVRILADRRPAREIAAEFGVYSGTIFEIKRGRTWAHVPR
jgi:hypothetical protein